MGQMMHHLDAEIVGESNKVHKTYDEFGVLRESVQGSAVLNS